MARPDAGGIPAVGIARRSVSGSFCHDFRRQVAPFKRSEARLFRQFSRPCARPVGVALVYLVRHLAARFPSSQTPVGHAARLAQYHLGVCPDRGDGTFYRAGIHDGLGLFLGFLGT